LSTTALTVAGNRPGVDFSKSFFRLTPKTLSINQPTTKAEDAIKGKLRITETGKQFDQIRVVLLVEPKEQRQYRVGEKGNNFSPENLLCFCSNVQKTSDGKRELTGPDKTAKMPQSLKCDGCSKSSWDRYRAKKDKNQTITEEDYPPCESFYKLLLLNIDDHDKPLYMYVRGNSRRSFENGLGVLTEMLFDINHEGVTPEVYYVSFVLKGKKDTKNTKTTTYLLDMGSFEVCTPEQIERFNRAYDSFAAAPPIPTTEKLKEEGIGNAQSSIDDAVTEGKGVATVDSTVVASGQESNLTEAEYVGGDEEIPV